MKKTVLIFYLIVISSLSWSRSITVSGISSGAAMASQLHVAFSELINGVGIIAGPPYGCARERGQLAILRCMQDYALQIDGHELWQQTFFLFEQGLIADPNKLLDDRVFLLRGTRDPVVSRRVMNEVKSFYQELPDASVKVVENLEMGHAFPTQDFGNPCRFGNVAPWLSDCDYDGAGELLDHLIEENLKRPIEAQKQAFYSFTQPFALSLARLGYAYVPLRCLGQKQCSIHMAIHGCEQGSSVVGESFYKGAGFNEYAQANDLIIIYPQLKTITQNLGQCWDWWGYSGKDYLTRSGQQMNALHTILQQFASGTIALFPLK